MRFALVLAMLAACGGGDDGGNGGPQLAISFQAQISAKSGTRESFLDKYVGHSIGIAVNMPEPGYQTSTQAGCIAMTAYSIAGPAMALGDLSSAFQTDVIDKLDEWDAKLELCDDPAQSSMELVGVIDELNTAFGCSIVPASAQKKTSDGSPQFSTFIAEGCHTTILDVITAVSLDSDDYTMTVQTDRATRP